MEGGVRRCRKSTIAQLGGCVALAAHSNRGVTTMRMNYQAAATDVMTAMIGLETYLARQSPREDGVDKPDRKRVASGTRVTGRVGNVVRRKIKKQKKSYK